jgi:TonB family protein
MTVLAETALRASVVLALALVAMPLLGRRSAALRHCLLAGAIGAAALVAPLSAMVPAWHVRVPAAVADTLVHGSLARSGAEVADAPPAGARTDDPALLIGGVWSLGAVATLGVLVVSLVRLRRVSTRAVPMTNPTWVRLAQEVADGAGLTRPLAVLRTDTPHLLATYGARRPRLLVPAHADRWSERRIRAVLCHEIAHVARHDWLVQLTAAALCALHWYNPLFWLACRRLGLESERACDDAVLRSGLSPRDYARHLLDLAHLCRSAPMTPSAIPMARSSTLRRRITAMLNTHLVRDAISRRFVVVVALAALAVALPAAAFRATQDGPLPVSGFVYDPTGAVLPGAELTLTDERQHVSTVVSDATGKFEFAPVEAGRYVLGVSLPGFRPLTQPIELVRDRDWHRAVTLQVGDVRETIVVREQRLPGTVAPSAGPLRIRVGGNIRPPLKLQDVRPRYPDSMRDAGLEGRVPLEAIIDRGGRVQSARVLTAAVHPDFAEAAIEAVRQWRFDPTLLNGEPVEVVMTVMVEFALEE